MKASHWPILLLLALGGWTAAPEGQGPGPGLGAVTNLPVPRFVTLRADTVNFRAGPGFQYPVSWIYQRDGLPVEIIGEFDVWRHVLAPDGGTGWVHQATIRARRGFIVTVPQASLYAGQDADSRVIAYLIQGVSGGLVDCASGDWCRAEVAGRTGFLKRGDFWGVFPAETFK